MAAAPRLPRHTACISPFLPRKHLRFPVLEEIFRKRLLRRPQASSRTAAYTTQELTSEITFSA